MTKLPKSDYGQASWFARKINSEGYKSVGAYYGYSQNGYQRFRHRYLGSLLQAELSDTPPDSVLDVGCGVGNFINHVAEIFSSRRVLGVDFVAPVAAAAAEQFPHIEFRQDSLPELSTISEQFELIITSEVLYYLNAIDRQKAMERLDELLAPGGSLLVSSTLAENAFSSAQELRQLMQTHFTIRHEWTQTSRLYLKLIQPFVLAHKVDTALPSADWSPAMVRLFRFFQLPVIGMMLRAFASFLRWFSRPILGSPRLAAWLTRAGNIFNPQKTTSNIILLLEKRESI